MRTLPPAAGAPIRILFVFAWLGSGADGVVRRLARDLGAGRYVLEAVACFANPDCPEPVIGSLDQLGIAVDRGPCTMSFEDTVAYLAGRLPSYDVVVAFQDVADIYPALERLHLRPALIEYGATHQEATAGPKHLTARYVGATDAIRDVAAGRMPKGHAITILESGDTNRWEALFSDVVAERTLPPRPAPLFRSFFQGGFESSTHRRASDCVRLDMIAATHHDTHAAADYAMLQQHGIWTVRDGLRWHLIESVPGIYDWSSLESQLAAAETTGSQVIWDLLHYGWPDHIDIWAPDFPEHFAAFAAAAARVIAARTRGTRFYAPVNEISFFAWAGGDVGYFGPFGHRRGLELKVQLARAAILAAEAIRADDAQARFVHIDPVMHVACDPDRPYDAISAEQNRLSQFEAWDMLSGAHWPQIGGRADILDVIGVNYYFNNQRVHRGAMVDIGDPLYRPFRFLLAETYARYGRPIFVAETGIEDDRRPDWLRYIVAEVRAAIAMGVPVEGICLYPILNHPGWDDGRPCKNGLLTHAIAPDDRIAFPPLAEALAEAQALELQAT